MTKLLAIAPLVLLLAACGADVGARVGTYGVRAGVGTTSYTPPGPPPPTTVVVNPVTGPALPPPLPE